MVLYAVYKEPDAISNLQFIYFSHLQSICFVQYRVMNYIENIRHGSVCSESQLFDPQPRFVTDQGTRTDSYLLGSCPPVVRSQRRSRY